MRPGLKFILAGLLACHSGYVNAQSFTFNCTRDTIIARCSQTPCFTLTAQVPDIRALSTSYTVNPIGNTATSCFPVYVQPNDPGGTSANLNLDDIYSSVLNIGFAFPFYGIVYNQAISSPNGMISFQVSNANQLAHYGILRDGPILSATAGVPLDLPSSLYDPAIIMGPYHDINPVMTTSPDRRVQYQLIGTAPHRKWIVSYYKMPLYSISGGCNVLIENTHQIVLYESTGIVEVLVFDKQPCVGWNDGRSMIGIQDASKTQALMVEGRKASDVPWGAPAMREAYRFVPAGGASLLKRVELCDLAGNVLMTGTTASLGNGKLEASFPNICPVVGSTVSYVVRSVYQKFDNPAVEVFGTDTVVVTKSAATNLNATFAVTNTSCFAPTGTITVTVPPGTATPPYTYILDGGTPVTAGSPYTFINVGPGNHTITVEDQSQVCTDFINVTIQRNNELAADVSTVAVTCATVSDGSITVTPTNGTGPFQYTIDGTLPQTGGASHTFSNLNAGNHTIHVMDATGCQTNIINVTVPVGPGVNGSSSTTSATCPGVDNGSITVNATGGIPPYSYQLDGGAFIPAGSSYSFLNVSGGAHVVTIQDNVGCSRVLNITVNSGPRLDATTSSTATSCNGASNGSITVTPTNGSAPYEYSLNGGPFVAGGTSYTFINVSSGNHFVLVRDAAGCVSNPINESVAPGPSLVTTLSKIDATCNGSATGSITVVPPALGVPPFQYSLDGVNWQASNVFSGLVAGSYTVFYRSSNSCMGTSTITINEPAAVSALMVTTPVRCNGETNGLIQVNATGGTAPYQYSIDGTNWQAGNQFQVAAGSYTIHVRDINNCTRSFPATMTEPLLLTAGSVNTNATCDGGNDGRILVNAAGGNSGYQYSINGTTYQTSNFFFVPPGNYTVHVKDNLGCSTSFTTTVGLTFNLTLTPQTDVSICKGSSTVLRAVSNATQYQWTPAQNLSDPLVYNPVASPGQTTQYVVEATLGRCTLFDTVLVTVNEAPIPNAGPDGDICYGQSFVLQGSGGVEYSWSPPIYLNNTSGANPVATPTRTTTYTLSVKDAIGCPSLVTDEVTILVSRPMRIYTYPFDTIVHPGALVQLRAASDSGIRYEWSPAWGLNDPNRPDPVATAGNIGDDISYQVVATSQAGCKGEGYVRLRIHNGPELYVPTGFTPNGDGKNDRFFPFPVGIKQLKYFRVFNRWGQLIFSTTTLHDGWDGRFQGREQPAGTYVWMAEAITGANTTLTRRGTVTLIR